MKARTKTKRTTQVLTLCGLVTASAAAVLWSCAGAGASTESFERSDYYTRGIGQYPGSPAEDFSPELLPDQTYRNIALLRAAYQSSSHDYNLVSQLITDGIITEKEPQYLNLLTPDGEKPRREREWMIDQGPYSRNVAIGEALQQDFAVIGINLTIETREWSVFLNERKEGKFDFCREGWLADYNDPINMLEMWETNSGNNDMQFGR